MFHFPLLHYHVRQELWTTKVLKCSPNCTLWRGKKVTQTPPPTQKRKQHECKMDIVRFVSKRKVIWGLSWLVLYSALRGFSSRNPLSLLTKKTHFDLIWLNSILYKSLRQITWRLYYNDLDYYDCGARGTCPCPGSTDAEDLGINERCVAFGTKVCTFPWGRGVVRGSCWWNQKLSNTETPHKTHYKAGSSIHFAYLIIFAWGGMGTCQFDFCSLTWFLWKLGKKREICLTLFITYP